MAGHRLMGRVPAWHGATPRPPGRGTEWPVCVWVGVCVCVCVCLCVCVRKQGPSSRGSRNRMCDREFAQVCVGGRERRGRGTRMGVYGVVCVCVCVYGVCVCLFVCVGRCGRV